jgi:hypothetical protein
MSESSPELRSSPTRSTAKAAVLPVPRPTRMPGRTHSTAFAADWRLRSSCELCARARTILTPARPPASSARLRATPPCIPLPLFLEGWRSPFLYCLLPPPPAPRCIYRRLLTSASQPRPRPHRGSERLHPTIKPSSNSRNLDPLISTSLSRSKVRTGQSRAYPCD